jgi:hypothetical protein
MSYTKSYTNYGDFYHRGRTKKIPHLDIGFLIEALGGEDGVIEIRDSLGLDLTILVQDKLGVTRNAFYGGVGFEIAFLNYFHFSYYPDIRIMFNSASCSKRFAVICEDIGEYETREESILRVRTWFHDKVIPTYLTNLFS